MIRISRFEIPEKLRAAAARNLVMFLGAGVSRFAGGCGWDDFAKNYIALLNNKGMISTEEFSALNSLMEDETEKKVLSDAKSLITNLSANGHLKSQDVDILEKICVKKQGYSKTKQALSICEFIRNQRGGRLESDDFRNLIIDSDMEQDGEEFLKSILSFNIPIFTTNYDNLIELVFENNFGNEQEISAEVDKRVSEKEKSSKKLKVVYRPEELKLTDLEQGTKLIKIHGCIKEPSKAVISDADYIHHYRNENIKSFMQYLFKSKTVLFMGYGLEEAEILAHLFDLEEHQIFPENRYWLNGYHKTDEELMKLHRDYFKDVYGISLLPYNLDQNGYFELVHYFNEILQSVSNVKRSPYPSHIKFLQESFS